MRIISRDEWRSTLHRLAETFVNTCRSARSLKRVGPAVIGLAALFFLFGGLGTSLNSWAQTNTPNQPPAAPPQATTPPQPKPTPPLKVEPVVTQREGTLTLSFGDVKLNVTSVKIGNVDATIATPPNSVTNVKVSLPNNTELGPQGITVATSEGNLTSMVTVVPQVTGLKANTQEVGSQLKRGVVAGGQTIIAFASNIPAEIKQGLKVKIGETDARIVDIQADHLVIDVPETDELKPAMQEAYPVGVFVEGRNIALDKQLTLSVVPVRSMYIRASLIVLGLIVLIFVIYKWFYQVPSGQTRYSFLTMVLLEPENQTYSLSRAQFAAWLTVIIWCYLFLYYSKGFVDGVWVFPDVNNAVYTFLISLGTLVAAQATSKGLGAKGAGEVHPSLADLVVHGGVLALDRVQQVIWTLIAIGMFVRITVTSYLTAKGLPEIPQDLLMLMGLSSAGYLGGKLVRGAGPVIKQVLAKSGSVILNIKGRNLSKDAFVWLDGVKLSKDKVTAKDDPASPAGFTSELEVTLDDLTFDSWNAAMHAITIINDDAQRAEWTIGPAITEVTPGAVENGSALLTVKGVHILPGATLTIDNKEAKDAQDKDNPNLFTVTLPEDWFKQAHTLMVVSEGRQFKYAFNPTPPAQQAAADNQAAPNDQAAADNQAAADDQATAGNQDAAGDQTIAGEQGTGDQVGGAQDAGNQTADDQASG